MTRNVACLSKTILGKALPNICPQEDLDYDALERRQIEVRAKQRAQCIPLKIFRFSEGHIEPVQQDPDSESCCPKDVIRDLEQAINGDQADFVLGGTRFTECDAPSYLTRYAGTRIEGYAGLNRLHAANIVQNTPQETFQA